MTLTAEPEMYFIWNKFIYNKFKIFKTNLWTADPKWWSNKLQIYQIEVGLKKQVSASQSTKLSW